MFDKSLNILGKQNVRPPTDAFLSRIPPDVFEQIGQAVREGLRLLEERDRLRAMRMDELKAKVQAGIDQAEAGELSDLDIGAVIEKAKVVKSRRSRKESA